MQSFLFCRWDLVCSIHCHVIFTCVKFAFANKIEAMYERLHVLCKRKSRNSLNLTFNLNTLYLTSILFTWLKFTCVNVRSVCRSNQTLPVITAFSSKVKIKYETEKYIGAKPNAMDKFNKKWALPLDSVP